MSLLECSCSGVTVGPQMPLSGWLGRKAKIIIIPRSSDFCQHAPLYLPEHPHRVILVQDSPTALDHHLRCQSLQNWTGIACRVRSRNHKCPNPSLGCLFHLFRRFSSCPLDVSSVCLDQGDFVQFSVFYSLSYNTECRVYSLCQEIECRQTPRGCVSFFWHFVYYLFLEANGLALIAFRCWKLPASCPRDTVNTRPTGILTEKHLWSG